jgi:hypothetical protein
LDVYNQITKHDDLMRRDRPVESKDGHKRTSSQNLTFVDPTTCTTG